MPSPTELLAAVKARPLTENEIAKLPGKTHLSRPWGWKGTVEVEKGYATKTAREIITPSHWRRVGIERRGERFSLVQLFSRVHFTSTDADRLELPDLKTEDLSLADALSIGAVLEQAILDCEKERVAKNVSKNKRGSR